MRGARVASPQPGSLVLRDLRRLLAPTVFALVASGCATLADRAPVPVPVVLQPYFSECQPADGAASLSLYRGGGLVGSGEAEWVAKDDELELQVLDPVGRALLKLTRKGRRINTTGALARKVPPLTVRPDGFVNLDGHLVALRADELPCLLAAHLPRAWIPLAREVAVEDDGDGRVVVADPERVVEISFKDPASNKKGRICARVTWTKFLWLDHVVTWCQQGEGRREGKIDGDGAYSLRIVQVAEEKS